MNKNKNRRDAARRAKTETTATEQQYVAPQIEIIDIEMQQNILSGSGTTPSDMPGEVW